MGKQKMMTLYERALEEGIEQGMERGRLEGEFRKALDTARKMREDGDTLERIIRITGLSESILRENGILSPP
jgi:predicted transposase YdaD